MSNEDNLIPLTTEKAREIGKKGGIASGEAKRQKKLMREIYAEFLEKEHDIIGKDGIKKKLSGADLLGSVMSKVLSRGDSSSVRLMREIREATEGSKIILENELSMTVIIEGVNSEPTSEENKDPEKA